MTLVFLRMALSLVLHPCRTHLIEKRGVRLGGVFVLLAVDEEKESRHEIE
jgi:hypothetical protein